MKKIINVGIAGAGTMGSALAQKFAQEKLNVIIYDISKENITRGLNNIQQTLNEAIDKKVFSEEDVKTILSNISATTEIERLKTCDLIIEAIFEDFHIKSDFFKKVSSVVPASTILATNTSSFSVSELAESVIHPERFIGLHYFYHAAKNRLVEIIPGKKTSDDTIKAAYYFSIQTGKDPIFTKDTYGFAVNRFFVPWLNESVKLIEDGTILPGEVDFVATKVFGIGMGPFALMNATGVPIAYHSQKTLEKFGNAYKVSSLLKTQAESKQNWKIDTVNSVEEHKYKLIEDRLLGCVFFVCSQIINENVCSSTDLNKGARIGLKWRKGPVEMMAERGITTTNKLIEQYAKQYNEQCVFVNEKQLELEWVQKKIINQTAYILFNRPEDLNALNEKVFHQLDNIIESIHQDKSVHTIIITSTGKAFVAGADIKFFIDNIEKGTVDKIVAFTQYAQSVLQKLDDSDKRVIAVLNGITLGGGLELALCADEIYALPHVNMAFPETGIGIYPGLGGTQRTQKRIGKELTKYLVFTGKILNAKEAQEIGLLDNILLFDDYVKVLEGNISGLQKQEKKQLSEKWQKIILTMQNIRLDNLSAQENEITKKMMQKAPVALKYADDLIEKQEGPSSELKYLEKIFTTEDALSGLKNIGKKVQFKGK